MKVDSAMPTRLSKPLLSGPTGAPLCIASIGECMVEMAPLQTAGQFQQSFAGDTLNTLWYLRHLCPDWTCRYVSRVGRDKVSDDMLAMMAGAGIETGHIQRDPERTVGLYMISLSEGERSFAYWRGQSAAKRLSEPPAQVADAIADADVVFFSGITLAILEAHSRPAFLQSIDTARHAGKTVVFDPNLRPKLWQDVAQMRDAVMAGAGVSDMILPSSDEEALHFGDANIVATTERYLAAGAGSVVVKNASDTLHFVHNGHTGQATPRPAEVVVDTTSAGDSFNAGLLAGLSRHASINDAIALGCDVARQVIGQKGALVALAPSDA
ncbi:sugar kinase [Gymnodinialimonas ulvae]|uniref:sugar kinase n=1 Tax=Gymnodinialimonas ulvae TaxID=3126504 RepID=UPI0030B1610F